VAARASGRWLVTCRGMVVLSPDSLLALEIKTKCDATCECRGNEGQPRAPIRGRLRAQFPGILPSDQICVSAACLALLMEWSG